MMIPETPGKSMTLESFIKHLRNGVAHGSLRFEDQPDSRNLAEVRIVIEGPDSPNQRAEIQGDSLYEFCWRLGEILL